MRTRVIAAAALLVAASACSAPPQSAPETSARVTIGGDVHTVHHIDCSQLQEFRTVQFGDAASGVEATMTFDGSGVKPKWVKIRNFGGFSGSFWDGGGGNAKASLKGDTYTVTGSAEGMTTNPPKPATTSFEIVANC